MLKKNHPLGGFVFMKIGCPTETLDELAPQVSYISVFTTHFLTNPVENYGTLKKLYIDLGLSLRDITALTASAWPKSTLLEAIKVHDLSKGRDGWLQRVKYGEQLVGGKLVPHPKEQRVISFILEWRGQGQSFSQIARNLNEKKIKSKKGGQWNTAVVINIYEREQQGE